MAKREKMTDGEKIVFARVKEALQRPSMTIHDFRVQAVYEIPRREARAIDALIRRRVRQRGVNDE